MQEEQRTQVQSLGWERATHSRILDWEIPWTEEPSYSPRACRVEPTERLSPHLSLRLFQLSQVLQITIQSLESASQYSGNPLQYSCLENPMDGGAWWAAVHGVAKSPARLSDFTFTFHFHALEKEMATHSSVLAWRIPGTGEPGGLLSMGSHRIGHN